MRKNKAAPQEYEFSMLTLDDDNLMTTTLKSYFNSAGYYVETENDPIEAIERIRNSNFDILLLDFLMTPICGDEVVTRIREFNKDIYIILLTGHRSLAPPIKTIRELDIQGYYEKSDRFDQLELLVESCVKAIRQMRVIRKYRDELEKTYNRLNSSFFEVVTALRSVVDARDIYTRGHSDRVSNFSALIGEAMALEKDTIERIALAGLFHDIGKIGVPDDILLKEARLTDDEYVEIKKHPSKGKQILLGLSFFSVILPIVESHHEWYNGTGYPNGLSGSQLPIESRIISVADAFDAMTSKRRYRKNLTIVQAVEQLNAGKNTQFDGDVVDAFVALLREYDIINNEDNWIQRIPKPVYNMTTFIEKGDMSNEKLSIV